MHITRLFDKGISFSNKVYSSLFGVEGGISVKFIVI